MSFTFTCQIEASFKDGCLSVRKSVLDKMRSGTAPGPIYNPKPRVLSTERSLRDIKFGTGPARHNDEPEHTKRRTPKKAQTPGPQTYDPGKIRNAIYVQSNQRNIPGLKFGTGKRACNADNSSKRKTPSPAEYDPEMIRRGIMFSKSGSTNVKFGTAQINGKKVSATPCPQTYDPEGIRRGITFTKKTAPSVKFGDPPKSSNRRGVSKNLDQQPGPQDYDTEKLRNGVYCLSNKRRPAGVKFTTGPRTYNDMEEKERASKPGPSSYPIPSTMGPQFNSRYKSQPTISFGVR